MTVPPSHPSPRLAVVRAVRLMLAVFLLVCAWATTHLDEAGGHHEGTAHGAITVSTLVHADDDATPDAALVPPLDTEATSVDAPDGSPNTGLLALAAAVLVALGVRPPATLRVRAVLSGAPPPLRHPLVVSGISRI